MNMRVSTTALLLCIASLTVVGCGTAAAKAQPLIPASSPAGGFTLQSTSSHGVLTSPIFKVDGILTAMNSTNDRLQSITLDVTKTYNDVDGPSPYSVGSKLDIHFDEQLYKLGHAQLKEGQQLQVKFGRFQLTDSKRVVLGSQFSWIGLLPAHSST
ncbi:MAG: hypothetical protein OWR52_09010 [Acidibacillus sp.]|nr:hypothetical protein [Acidibacillus sp.]